MQISSKIIYCVILFVSYNFGCNNNVREDHNTQLDNIIINEIFNEGFIYEGSKIEQEYDWIRDSILKNCLYYDTKNLSISFCNCYWGDRLKGLPFYRTLCLYDIEDGVKLCFNFNDWKCLKADYSYPCFNSEYYKKIKECNSYLMLSNYLNFYIDKLYLNRYVEMDEYKEDFIAEITTVVDSVFENLLYCKRYGHHDSQWENYVFEDIKNYFKTDSNSCCLQILDKNIRYLEDLQKRDDTLLYYDVGIHMFWIVSINYNPKEGVFGKRYLTLEPFNYECAYWVYF